MLFGVAGAIVTVVPVGGAFAQDEALIERGRYLVTGPMACANCHTPRAPDMSFLPGMDLAGGFEFNDPGMKAYARNITPDVETGIGSWTDEEIIVAMREGKTPEGEVIGPPMPTPTYNNMSDDDAKAVVAYLRSIPAVRNEVPESKYEFPLAAMPPAKGLPAPPASDQVAYGGYIVLALAHCFECHTPMGPAGPDMSKLGAGGFDFAFGSGIVKSANITPDKETGIGEWTDAEIKAAIVEGKGAHDSADRPLLPLMPVGFFKNMTDEDVDAIVAYLRTIPPVVNEVERTDFRTLLPPPPQ